MLLRAGVVLFGRAERVEAELPQCLLRVARFRGTDRTEFLDNRQFHGNVFELLLRAERFLRETLPVAGRVVPGLFERVDDPLYPPVALREALFVPHESLPWNPLIARVLYRRGIIESWGRGTLKIAELATQAGLPRPEIEDAAGCVTVRFRPSWYVSPQRVTHDLSHRQQAVLELLAPRARGLALRQIKVQLKEAVPDWELKADLALLRNLGLVETSGHGRGARWVLVGSALGSGIR